MNPNVLSKNGRTVEVERMLLYNLAYFESALKELSRDRITDETLITVVAALFDQKALRALFLGRN
jgi:hypothetical protein